MNRVINIITAGVTFFALAAPAVAANMTDCTYTSRIAGKTATIVVQGGEPVSYRGGSYNAKKVYREGSTIFVDAATLANLRVGATQSGQPAFQGDWRLGNFKANVTFICR